MRDFVSDQYNAYFGRQLELKIRVFNTMGLSGALICLLLAWIYWGKGDSLYQIPWNLVTALFIFGLLVFGRKTRRYDLCYILVVGVIYFVIYTIMFFTGGGYRSGMPSFFIFAVVFTFYMLEGKMAVCMAILELFYYSGLCVYAYYNPNKIIHFVQEGEWVTDVVASACAVALSIGAVMYIQFHMYRTQQSMLEEAKREAEHSSQAKGSFLANMGHEIRTPINVILGMNEMILREAHSKQVREYSSSIENAGQMLLGLMNNILDVSKLESGKMEILSEKYAFAEFVDELALIGRELVKEKNLLFRVESDPGIPQVLMGDCLRIKQIIFNFLSNAVKYTDQGEILLKIVESPSLKQKPDQIWLRFLVRDTGIGIREENITILFDAFTRVDLPLHRNIEGTGLGLSIAKNLTDLMGGNIWVESSFGSGSTFYVEVPQQIPEYPCVLEKKDGDGQKTKEHAISFRPLTACGSRILVVDDNRENLMVIKALLKRTRAAVDLAEGGEQCLKLVQKNRYDLIFMDYMMPGMNGIETYRRLQKEQHMLEIPVVALTAATTAETRQELEREGFADCLSKPVRGSELEETMRRWLPAGMVLSEGRENQQKVTEKLPLPIREQIKEMLEDSFLSLDKGMGYFEEDFSSYVHLARLMYGCYEWYDRELKEAWQKKDWDRLSIKAHGFKSNARALGAEELYAIAEQIEHHGKKKDEQYLNRLVPLFLLSWSRVHDALGCFLKAAGPYLPQRPEQEPDDGKQPLWFCMEECERHLRLYRRRDALKCLDKMKQKINDENLRSGLEEIKRLAADLEFEAAGRMLKQWAKNGNIQKEHANEG